MSIFQTHAGECFVCFMIMNLMSPHLHPSKALQADRQSWKKITVTSQEKKSAKGGVIAAGKMLKKYFQRWTITKRQVKGKHQVALESNVYSRFQNFFAILSKLRLLFFILLPRSWKSN